MSAEHVEATTFRCDLAGCENTQVVAGDKPSAIIVSMFGWSLGHEIFRVGRDLCKVHTDELRDWIDGSEGPAISCTCTTKIDVFCGIHGLESKEPVNPGEVGPLA